MTSEELRSIVSYNERILERLYAERSSLVRERDELIQVKEKIRIAISKLEEFKADGLGVVEEKGFVRNNIYYRYSEGMKTYLGGAEYERTYRGLTSALELTRRRLDMVMENIRICDQNIRYRKERIDNLKQLQYN